MKIIDTEQYSIQELTRFFHDGTPEIQLELVGLLSIDPRQGARDIITKHLRARERQMSERHQFDSMLRFERQLKAEGYARIAGADEAGRGALAGPIVAAAVILPDDFYLGGLKDSKKLSRERREEFFAKITEQADAWAVAAVSNKSIDDHGIQKANVAVLTQAVVKLRVSPDYVLTDGLSIAEHLNVPSQNLIRGDSLSVSIAAASIIAKVIRDRMMFCLHDKYPEYDFLRHVGYGTANHFMRIQDHGISKIHRITFISSD